MGSGILGGLGLGAVVSAIILAGVSLSTPLPDTPEAGARAASGAAPAETGDAAPDAPDAPEPAPPPADADPATGDGAPADAGQSEPSAPPTEDDSQRMDPPAAGPDPEPETSLADPGIDPAGPGGLGLAEAPRTGRIALPQVDAVPSMPSPSAPAAGTASDEAPPLAETATAPAPDIASSPEQPMGAATPVAPRPRFMANANDLTPGAAPRGIGQPQAADTLGDIDTTPAPRPETREAAGADEDLPRAPALGEDGAADGEPAERAAAPDDPQAEAAQTSPRRITLPQVAETLPDLDSGAQTTAPQPTGAGLPQIADAPADPAAMPETGPEDAESPAAEPQGPPDALRDNAVDFAAPEGRPLMAVVLIDDPESPLDPGLLTRFTFPVTFAIDPLRADAAARAAELRDAGFEIVILGASVIPDGATPSDVEVAIASARETIPQAVAVMDTPDSRIQSDRAVLDATVSSLGGSGHGLLAFPRGLNAAEQTARREEVPAATFFRLLDDEDQRATVITRYLGRVAFAAGQDGAVVVAGRTRPDTVTALFSWALGSRSETVMLAPVSAVLDRMSE